MYEEVKKLEESVQYEKEFRKKYPDFWKMRSYYSWNDAHPIFDYVKDNVCYSITYDKIAKRVTNTEIRLQNSDCIEEYAKDPILFLQKQFVNVPIFINDNKSVIDFAQETILKAIKGA